MDDNKEMFGMVDRPERKILIDTLYEKRKERYPDLRQFNSVRKLINREKKIVSLLTNLPNKKGMATEKEKKLQVELSFVRLKKRLCYGENPPMVMTLDRALLQIYDSYEDLEEETELEKEEAKKECSLILLRYALISKSDKELQEMILSK